MSASAIRPKPRASFFVVKIQRPLSTNAEVPEALIYDKRRRVQVQLPFSAVQCFFQPEELKVYCLAKLEGTILHIIHKTTGKGW